MSAVNAIYGLKFEMEKNEFHRSNILNMRWKATLIVRFFQYMSFI